MIGPNKDNLVHGINMLESTTRLLMKYNPELTCTLLGGKKVLDMGLLDAAGGRDGKSAILDTSLLFGADSYRYPDNLPINGQKGGPGGAPGCGSLPDVSKNWPVRYVVTNSGWGTGLDVRPNLGIGFPGYADYLPVTRGIPQPPSLRHPSGPAPGPMPCPRLRPGCTFRRTALRGAVVRPGWDAAISGLAAGASAGQAARTRPAASGLGAVRARSAGRSRPTCGVVTQVCGRRPPAATAAPIRPAP